MRLRSLLPCAVLSLVVAGQSVYSQPAQKNTYYNKWANAGPLKNAGFFPIAVWHQPASRAADYAATGVNMYISPRSTSSSDLANFKNNGISMIANFSLALKNDVNSDVVVGWKHQDEPDNDQNGAGCIDPLEIQTKYNSWTTQDPNRPVYLNLGKGVAYIEAGLRGSCSGKWEMYIDYLKGCDIPSFDIYPVTDKDAAVSGHCWYVAKGIDSLRSWSLYEKPCWLWIECTHINSTVMPTPVQTKSEIWQALVHEAGGFGYFCHEWYPSFSEVAWLTRYPEMKAAITKINAEIKQLARPLNSPTVADQVTVEVNWRTPVETMLKNEGGNSYLFCVSNRRSAPSNTATIKIDGMPSSVTSAEVIGEGRTVTVSNGQFQDTFSEWQVHLYKFGSQVAVRETPEKTARRLERTIRFTNPAPGRLMITKHFDLKGQALDISVYDASGRLVKGLGSSVYLPTIAWDGTDAQGVPVPDGFYYVSIATDNASLVKPFVMVR